MIGHYLPEKLRGILARDKGRVVLTKILRARWAHVSVGLLAIVMCVASGSLAFASEITLDDAGIHLRGEIQPGDYQKMLRIMNTYPPDFLSARLWLDSNGGSVEEAIKISGFVRDLYLPVLVPPGSHCASACFLIFVSAVTRAAVGNVVGVHRPYFSLESFAGLPPNEADRKYRNMAESVKTFLERNDVPRSIIEHMFSLASNEIYWLDDNDLHDLGHRPAWYDQYILSKCGFDTKMQEDANDDPKVQSWLDCELDAVIAQAYANAASKKYWLTLKASPKTAAVPKRSVSTQRPDPPRGCEAARNANECFDLLKKAGRNPFDAFGFRGSEPLYPDDLKSWKAPH